MTEFDNGQPRDAFFSKRIRAGKRTYYFDVKATRANDYYITITESKRKPGESEDRPFFEKHKLFLYKEDFEKFTEGLQEALTYIQDKRSGEMTEVVASPVSTAEHAMAEPASQSTSFTDLNFDDLDK
jgi:hypothetical protein